LPANARTVSRLLCGCLRGALGGPPTASDLPANSSEWEQVLHLSRAHLAAPQLRWALLEQGLFSQLPPDMAKYLEAVYGLNLDRNQQCEDQLAQLIPLLNRIGVQPVLLKGAAAIVGRLYPTSGERMISDLDILIPAEKLPEIIEKLAEVSYRPYVSAGMKIPDPLGFDNDHHYPPLISPEWQTRVELHVQPLWLSTVAFLPCKEVFREAIPLAWRGGECLLPSPTHFIIHNLVHAFVMNVQGGLERVSIRQLFEFVLASKIYAERIDWNAVKNRFDDLGRLRALQEYLALANTCFDFEVPIGIDIDERARRRARWYLTRLDSYHPALELAIKILFQIKRVGHLRKDPKKLRMLLTTDFYSRLFDSFKV
jgi:hypothetical protein